MATYLVPVAYNSFIKDLKDIKTMECIRNISVQCPVLNLSFCPNCTSCPEKVCSACNKTENIIDTRELVIYVANETCRNNGDYEVWKFAESFASLLEEGNPEKIYSLLSEKKKKAISKTEFAEHYAGVVYGSSEIYTDDRIISSSKKNIFSAVFVESFTVSNSTAHVSLINLRKDGTYERFAKYKFAKEAGSWRIDDFDVLVYTSCSETLDCNSKSSSLMPVCEKTCREKSRFYDLRNDTPFSCAGEVCECRCINNRDKMGHVILPNPEFID
jgi:hypothetical protein